MTVNLIQQQDALRGLTDEQLARQMQNPTGSVPLYLISTEAKRRADLRERFRADQAEPPRTTVQEDLLRSILTGQEPPTGIAQNLQPAPRQTQAQQGLQPQLRPQTPLRAPPRQVPMRPQMPPQARLPGPGMLAPTGIMQGGVRQGLPGNVPAPRRGFQRGGLLYPVKDYYRGDMDAVNRILSIDPEAGDLLGTPQFLGAGNLRVRKEALRLAADKAKYDPHLQRIAAASTLGSGDPALTQLGTSRGVPELISPYISAAPDPATLTTTPVVTSVGGLARLNRADALRVQPGDDAPRADPNAASSAAPNDAPRVDPNAAFTASLAALGDVPQRKIIARPEVETSDYSDLYDARFGTLSEGDDPYGGLSDRLTKREGKLADAEKMNLSLALMRGGLGIMGGTSPNAFENISRGGLPALIAYGEGREGIEERRDKLFTARAGLVGKRQDLKIKFMEIADKQARGEMSQVDADNAKRAALYRMEIEEETARVVNEQAVRADNIKHLEFQQRVRESAADRISRERIAGMPPATLRTIQTIANMPEGTPAERKLKADMTELLNPTNEAAARAKLKAEGLFQDAIKLLELDVGGEITPVDRQRIQTAYMRMPGANLDYLPLFMLRLGSGAAPPPSEGALKTFTQTRKP